MIGNRGADPTRIVPGSGNELSDEAYGFVP
jgi:hypothetical protein